jgi:hypothetical protein
MANVMFFACIFFFGGGGAGGGFCRFFEQLLFEIIGALRGTKDLFDIITLFSSLLLSEESSQGMD